MLIFTNIFYEIEHINTAVDYLANATKTMVASNRPNQQQQPQQQQSSSGTISSASTVITAASLLSKLQWLQMIQLHERRIFSQNGEDGILEYIFDNLGTTDKFYVEFGTENGDECNTRLLWERYGWDGVLLDGGGKAKDGRVIHNHFISAENIVDLFKKYKVPKELDLLSVDIDANDFYVARKIFEEGGYRPRVFICEYNRNFAPKDSYTIAYNSTYRWDGTAYFGVSALAWMRLMERYGYAPIYLDVLGINMFFVRRKVMVEYLEAKMGWTKESGDMALTEEDVKVLMPTFESVYRRSEYIHSMHANKDFERVLKNRKWMLVKEDGEPVPHQF
jgi:hypothetical protein